MNHKLGAALAIVIAGGVTIAATSAHAQYYNDGKRYYGDPYYQNPYAYSQPRYSQQYYAPPRSYYRAPPSYYYDPYRAQIEARERAETRQLNLNEAYRAEQETRAYPYGYGYGY